MRGGVNECPLYRLGPETGLGYRHRADHTMARAERQPARVPMPLFTLHAGRDPIHWFGDRSLSAIDCLHRSQMSSHIPMNTTLIASLKSVNDGPMNDLPRSVASPSDRRQQAEPNRPFDGETMSIGV